MTADPARPTTGLPPKAEPFGDRALEAATDWLFRLQAEPADAALRHDHDRWLAADASHAAAWLAVQRSWRVTGQLKSADNVIPLPRRSAPRRVAMLAGALAACLLIALALPAALLQWRAEAVTATGETRSLTLDDGSTVTLGGDSAFASTFEPQQRRIALLHGEAHFQVAPDRQRPFVIAAGPVTVTVVGTAFDVTMDGQAVAVAVASGVVQVQAETGEALVLQAGDRLSVARSGAISHGRIAPEDVGAWRERRLVLHDLPLRAAMARLDRYHRGEILVLPGSDSAALDQQRVSGIFDLDDPVRALRGMLGAGSPELRAMTVREITPYLIVLNK